MFLCRYKNFVVDGLRKLTESDPSCRHNILNDQLLILRYTWEKDVFLNGRKTNQSAVDAENFKFDIDRPKISIIFIALPVDSQTITRWFMTRSL